LAQNLLVENPSISSQVISEYLNTTRRILNLSKEDLLIQTANLFSGCNVIPVGASTLSLAGSLVIKYQFQLFDAVVVAAAIEGGCDLLYSEDMHHGLIVNKCLTIFNPFKN